MTVFLTLEEAMRLGSRLLAVEGEELVVRDPGLLQSALLRPQTSAFGEDAYPSLFGKAAALMDSLPNNRALIDGNTRLAWAGTKLFLLLNDRHLYAPSAAEGETSSSLSPLTW